MQNILEINTSDNKGIYVGIKGEEKITSYPTLYKSESALFLIDKLLKKRGLKIKDLNGVSVNLGPGSFTGLRVGSAIANALSFLLKIPVNGTKIGELVGPVYNK